MKLLAVAALSVLAACPSFHAGALPGAPADATFVDVDGIHVRYREVGSGPVRHLRLSGLGRVIR